MLPTDLLAAIAADVAPYLDQGRVADYIPALAQVDPRQFGMAFAPVEGEATGVGAWRTPFSLQSVGKVFSLALVMARDGEALWSRVGKEPSGSAFNSLVQLEHERGIPRNPFINAGALVVMDRLVAQAPDAAVAVRDFLRTEAENPGLDWDEAVAASELRHGARNAALAHFMASFGNLENPVDRVLDAYVRTCALRLSCRDLALAGRFLARHGLRADGSRLLTPSEAKRIHAIMLTCGTYDAAGEFAYRVGLPVKSGVGGGLLAILPGRGVLATWAPGLDTRGNSLAGLEALDRFTTRTGWSVF